MEQTQKCKTPTVTQVTEHVKHVDKTTKELEKIITEINDLTSNTSNIERAYICYYLLGFINRMIDSTIYPQYHIKPKLENQLQEIFTKEKKE